MSIPIGIPCGSVYSTLTLKCSSFRSQNPCCCISYTTPKLSVISGPENSQYPPPILKLIKSRILTPPPSATEAAVAADPQTEASDSSASQDAPLEVKEVVVKPVGKQIAKPRLVLKFIWMEKNIGLGLDQLIPGHGAVPLSPYFFWPRKDAWEELRAVLESKPSISQKKMIILLNQATDIINLWQQSGGNLS